MSPQLPHPCEEAVQETHIHFSICRTLKELGKLNNLGIAKQSNQYMDFSKWQILLTGLWTLTRTLPANSTGPPPTDPITSQHLPPAFYIPLPALWSTLHALLQTMHVSSHREHTNISNSWICWIRRRCVTLKTSGKCSRENKYEDLSTWLGFAKSR